MLSIYLIKKNTVKTGNLISLIKNLTDPKLLNGSKYLNVE